MGNSYDPDEEINSIDTMGVKEGNKLQEIGMFVLMAAILGGAFYFMFYKRYKETTEAEANTTKIEKKVYSQEEEERMRKAREEMVKDTAESKEDEISEKAKARKEALMADASVVENATTKSSDENKIEIPSNRIDDILEEAKEEKKEESSKKDKETKQRDIQVVKVPHTDSNSKAIEDKKMTENDDAQIAVIDRLNEEVSSLTKMVETFKEEIDTIKKRSKEQEDAIFELEAKKIENKKAVTDKDVIDTTKTNKSNYVCRPKYSFARVYKKSKDSEVFKESKPLMFDDVDASFEVDDFLDLKYNENELKFFRFEDGYLNTNEFICEK